MQPKVLNAHLSKLMKAYYLHIHPPMKFRFWNLWKSLTGYARMKIPYANNGWITLDERDLVQREILTVGYYESEVWDALANFIVTDEVVWDVGAHIGSFAVRAMLHPKVKEVHCFEPSGEIAAILRINLGLNQGRFQCHQIGLSDREEERTIFLGPVANTGITTLKKDLGNGALPVRCASADEVVRSRDASPPTLLKIDAEGWELQILEGARQLFALSAPKAVVFEADCDSQGNLENMEIEQFFRSFEYQISWIKRPSGIIDTRENFIAVNTNFRSRNAAESA